MNELTVEDLFEVWKYGIEKYGGGGAGAVHPEAKSKLDSVLFTAQYYAFQDDDDGNALAYAGSILFYLGSSQHMPDGNKRLAWGACTKALEVNGYSVEITDELAVQLVIRIGDSQRDDHLGKADDVVEALSEFLVEADWAPRTED